MARQRDIIKSVAKSILTPRFDRAIVRRVDGNRVDVVTIRSSNAIRNVQIGGNVGQLNVGDRVTIVWSDERPVVVYGDTYTYNELASVEKPVFPELPVETVTGEGIKLYHASGQIEIFPVTSAGLTDALARADINSVVSIPAAQLAGDFTVPGSTTVLGIEKKSTVIQGVLTIEGGSKLQALTVFLQLTSDNDIYTIIGPEDTGLDIQDCRIYAFNCGAGDANAVQAHDADIKIKDTILTAESSTGDGHVVNSAGTGKTYLTDCSTFSNSDFYTDDSLAYVYSCQDGLSEIATYCGSEPLSPDGIVLRNIPDMSPSYPHAKEGELECTLDEATTSLTATHLEHAGEMWDIGRSVLTSENSCYIVDDNSDGKAAIYKGIWLNDPVFLMYIADGYACYIRKWTLAGVDDIFALYQLTGPTQPLTFARYKLWYSTPTKEIVETWSTPRTQDGVAITSESAKGVFATVIDDDKYILVINEAYSGATKFVYHHILIYKVDSATEVITKLYDEVIDPVVKRAGTRGTYAITATGRFYNNKFIYGVSRSSERVNWGEISTIVVDLENLTVTKYDFETLGDLDMMIQLDDAAINKTLGRYYFLAQESGGTNTICYFDLGSSAFVTTARTWNYLHHKPCVGWIQGKSTCYYIEFYLAYLINHWNVYDPSAGGSGMLFYIEGPDNVPPNDTYGGAAWCKIFDETNQRIWKYDKTTHTMHGYTLGGAFRTVTLSGLPVPVCIDPYNIGLTWDPSLYLFNNRFVIYSSVGKMYSLE